MCLSYPLPVSPSVVTIYLLEHRSFSLYSLVYQTPPCHIHPISSFHPLTYPVPPFTFHILLLGEPYSIVGPHAHICASRAHTCIHALLPATRSPPGTSLSSFGYVLVPYTKSQFQLLRVVHWAVHTRFHFSIVPHLPYISMCFASFILLISVSFPFFYTLF